MFNVLVLEDDKNIRRLTEIKLKNEKIISSVFTFKLYAKIFFKDEISNIKAKYLKSNILITEQ